MVRPGGQRWPAFWPALSSCSPRSTATATHFRRPPPRESTPCPRITPTRERSSRAPPAPWPPSPWRRARRPPLGPRAECRPRRRPARHDSSRSSSPLLATVRRRPPCNGRRRPGTDATSFTLRIGEVQTMSLTPDQLLALQRLSTCVVADAIETFDIRLRNVGFADGTIRCCFEDLPPIVGYAATARIRTAKPPVVGPA